MLCVPCDHGMARLEGRLEKVASRLHGGRCYILSKWYTHGTRGACLAWVRGRG